jgi:hypothetical protein
MLNSQSIDPRTDNAPQMVRVREQQKLKLMTTDADDAALPPDTDLSDVERVQHLPKSIPNAAFTSTSKDPLEIFSSLLKEYGEHKDVRVRTSIGVITLKALHVSINPTGVGLILSKDDTQIEPAFGTELTLEIEKQTLEVIYGGGLFTFKQIPVTFLSFFRVNTPEEKTPA